MKKIISVILVCAFLLSLGTIAYAEGEYEETNPYVDAYLRDIAGTETTSDSNKEDYDATIQSLSEYYYADYTLQSIISTQIIDGNLITSLKKEDKINAMHVLMSEYDMLDQKTQDLIYEYFKRYANDTGDNESIAFYKKINERRRLQASAKSGFNPSLAASWAYDHYDSFDSNFPNMRSMGGDCTNFVSQALYNGGMSMRGDWYCYKKNSTYLEPTSATQLDYSWTLSDPSPWISVSEFSSFWLDYYDDYYEYTKSDYESNHSTYYSEPIYKGDVIILCKRTLWWTTPSHAMIITEYDTTNRDFKLAGHTTARQAYPLLDAIDNYAVVRIYCL